MKCVIFVFTAWHIFGLLSHKFNLLLILNLYLRFKLAQKFRVREKSRLGLSIALLKAWQFRTLDSLYRIVLGINKQEAHGPRFANLSDIANADMHMLCNIFPILSSQLMKISSFEQFLVLKKNIWAWQSMEHDHLNKQCEIWWKLAKWFLKNHDFIHVNSTVAGKY